MADPIFFQSANRFLAASPSGDFGLYGAQPTVEVSVAAPPADTAVDLTARDTGNDTALPLPSVGQAPEPLTLDLADPSSHEAPAGSSTLMPMAFQPGIAAEPAYLASSPLNPFDLRPVTLTGLEPHASPEARPDTAPGSDGGVHDAAPDEAAELPAAFSAPVLGDAAPVVGDTVGTAVGLVDPVVDTVAGLAGHTINTVIGITEPVLDTVANTVSGALDLVGNAVDGVSHVVDGLATPLLTTLGEVGHVADDIPVADLLGSDPAGGISTLVNLVTVTDLLDLRDAGAPGDPGHVEAPDPVSGLLDTLTSDIDLTHHDGTPHPVHGDDAAPIAPLLPVQPILDDVLGGHHDPLGLGG